MSPQKLDEIFKKYRTDKARCAYLNSEMETLRRWLRICEEQSINDRISLSQAISGMPHGTGIGDPTGRLAIDIASGKVSEFVDQILVDMNSINAELGIINYRIGVVENVLKALADREREVLIFKIIDDRDWGDTVNQMNGMHNNSYSKRTLQRLLDRALEKAYEVVK